MQSQWNTIWVSITNTMLGTSSAKASHWRFQFSFVRDLLSCLLSLISSNNWWVNYDSAEARRREWDNEFAWTTNFIDRRSAVYGCTALSALAFWGSDWNLQKNCLSKTKISKLSTSMLPCVTTIWITTMSLLRSLLLILASTQIRELALIWKLATIISFIMEMLLRPNKIFAKRFHIR